MRFKKIGPKVILSIALFVFLTGTIVGLLSYFTAKSILSHRMQKVDMPNLLSAKSSKVSEVLYSAITTSRMLAANQNLNHWFKQEEKDEAIKQKVFRRLKFITKVLDYPIVFAANTHTNNYWTQNSNKPTRLSPKNKSDDWFYDSMKQAPGSITLDLDTSDFLGGTYMFVNILMGPPNGKAYGIAGIGFPIEQLIDSFTRHNYGSHAQIWLINDKGVIQVGPNKINFEKNIKNFLPNKIFSNLLTHKHSPNILHFKDYNNKKFVIGSLKLANTPWFTVIKIAETHWLSSALKPIEKGIIYSCLASIIIISFVLWLIIRSKINLAVDFSTAITALGNKNFSIKLKKKLVNRQDEFGDMAKGYEQSRHNLYDAYQENKRILHGLEDTVKSRTKDIQHINEVACAINSTLNFDDILATLLDKLQPILNFDQIKIFLLNKNKSALVASHCAGTNMSKELWIKIQKIEFPINGQSTMAKTLVDEAIKHIEYIDSSIVANFSKLEAKQHKINPVTASLMLPLIVQRKVIGTIILSHTTKKMTLTSETKEKILRYVVQISNAVQNAQLFNDLKSTRLKLLETEKIASMTKAFERFVPKQFISRLTKTGVEDVTVGMVEQNYITIIFSDIRRFTNLAESMSPKELLRFLNTYLARMNKAIVNNNGFIDKFIGDAIMGIFDEEDDDHYKEARQAVKTAIEMHHSLLTYNKKRSQEGLLAVEIGIGIHSGPVVVGTVGSEDRIQTTVLGDSVNISARLETITKLYKSNVIISAQTEQFIKTDPSIRLRPLDYIKVKGKDEAIHIFEVINADPPQVQDLKNKTILNYHAARARYYKQDWRQAKLLFEKCLKIHPDDIVPKIYLQRISEFTKSPPAQDWQGIFVATEK